MAKYLFIYKSQQDWSTLPKDQIEQIMQVWGEWVGTMGAAIVEGGNPFKPTGKQVSEQGVGDAQDLVSGYTIVEARDFDEALSMAQGVPTLDRGGTVEVYEAFGM